MTNEMYSELYYCINTLWHEYIISSKEHDRLRTKLDKEYEKTILKRRANDKKEIQKNTNGKIQVSTKRS